MLRNWAKYPLTNRPQLRNNVHAVAIINLPPIELKIKRIRAGILQKQLAKVLGIGRSHLSEYENGRKRPRPETLARILKAIDEWDSHHD